MCARADDANVGACWAQNLLRDDSELEAWDECSNQSDPPYLSASDVLVMRCMIATSERTRHASFLAARVPPAKQFMLDIVCNSRNSIDVDKFDYLMRDAYFCGTLGRPQPHRLMDNCRVINGVLCYQKKVLNSIFQLFAVRANNFREIYGHRVTRAIEFMFMDVMELVDAHLGISAAAADPAKFIALDDSIIRHASLLSPSPH